MTQGLIALNAMLKGFQADGINLFRQTQLEITVGAMQGLPSTIGTPITISPLVLGIEECRVVIQPSPNLYERPLAIYSYIDYMNLPNKQSNTSSGPSVITFDKQVNQSLFYIWPLATNGCVLHGTFARTVNDVTQASDPVDYPDEWTEGGIYSLADRLMDDSGMAAADPATAARIQQHAAIFYQKLLNFDRPSSVFVRPWGSRGSGKFWR